MDSFSSSEPCRWKASDPDTASFLSTDTDALSIPTNGYFASRAPQPDDMYVDTAAANRGMPKVRVNSTSPMTSREGREQETTPLLDSFVGQDGPPSYLEATTPLPWNASRDAGEGARLLEEGMPPYTPMRMETNKEDRYRRRALLEHFTKRKLIKWGAVLLAIVLLAAILAAATNKQKNSSTIPAQPVQSSVPAPPASQPEFPIRWPSRCGKGYNTKSVDFTFGAPSDFRAVENVGQLEKSYNHVFGWIHVAPAPASQAAGTIEARVSFAASPAIKIDSIDLENTLTGLVIGKPNLNKRFVTTRSNSPCLGISIVIYVASATKLQNFDVRSTYLGMQVHRGVDLTVTKQTSVSLTTGTLDSATFSSRETRLTTVSGSISGKYSLLDLLSIDTKSGSVNINVTPQAADKSAVKPARFLVSSQSGSIRADFDRKTIPDRDYNLDIRTTAGSIDGSFIHGSSSTITSVSGTITADFVPFTSGSSASDLTTSTTDGKTTIYLQAPYNAGGTALTGVKSSHKSISGALDITYPQEWEGHFLGKSVSGMLHLRGKDLELTRKVEQPGLNLVEGRKGAKSARGDVRFGTTSGEVVVKIGKA